nr:hypothetical protein Iba_chr08fCG2600 [Ipomoea batatas]
MVEMIEGCVNEARMAQWEEMGELCIEEEDIGEPYTLEDEMEELYATCDPIGEEPPPKMTRNKSIGKKPAPKVPQIRGSGTLRFNSAEHRERYQIYMQKPVVPPFVIKLDTLEEFGTREEVEAFLGEKEWKYLLVDFEDEIYPDLVLEVMTTLQIPKTIDLMSTKCICFTVGSIVFQFSPDDLSRYLEIDAMQGLSEEELEERDTIIPEIPYKKLKENKSEIDKDMLLSIFKDMRAIIEPGRNSRKRARRGAAAQAQEEAENEEEGEEGHEEEMRAVPGAGEGSSGNTFEQQVLAQLAAMQLQVGQVHSEVGLLNSRMDNLETTVGRLETRNEAHAYQTWLRGQFPPGPQYYYDPAGGPPYYYDHIGGPPHFYSSAGGSQPYYGAAGGSQYYYDPAGGSQPQHDPSRGPQFPYDPTDF